MTTKHTAAFRAAQPDAPAGGLAALAHAVVTTPDSAITDAMRAEAAATAAKVDGSPVATNGKQEAELAGEWKCKFANHNFIVSRHGDSPAFSCIFEGSGEWLAKTLNSHASLHAYAKAEELKWKWSACFFPSPEWDVCKQNFDACLRSMGWDETTTGCMTFLKDYRAAALAKAGGQ